MKHSELKALMAEYIFTYGCQKVETLTYEYLGVSTTSVIFQNRSDRGNTDLTKITWDHNAEGLVRGIEFRSLWAGYIFEDDFSKDSEITNIEPSQYKTLKQLKDKIDNEFKARVGVK